MVIIMADIIPNHDLSHNNTMALSCTACHAMILDDADTLGDDIAAAIDFAKCHELPLFVLSYGSNVILPNTLNALVLMPKIQGIEVVQETNDGITLQVACGENWHDLIKTCLNKGYFGLENLALIPGLVGACPVQNIGAYGVQVSDFITKVIAYDLTDGQRYEFDNTACQFGYRYSFFKANAGRYLISHVIFTLHKDPKVLTNYGDLASLAQEFANNNKRDAPHPIDVFHAVISIRQSKLPDPAVLANCGSFFQNPIVSMSQFTILKEQFANLSGHLITDDLIKIPAGWLIEQAGLKGGGVAPILTYDKQALVLTNHAPHIATQDDIYTAQNFIIRTVQDKFGITLVREPVWVV